MALTETIRRIVDSAATYEARVKAAHHLYEAQRSLSLAYNALTATGEGSLRTDALLVARSRTVSTLLDVQRDVAAYQAPIHEAGDGQ